MREPERTVPLGFELITERATDFVDDYRPYERVNCTVRFYDPEKEVVREVKLQAVATEQSVELGPLSGRDRQFVEAFTEAIKKVPA